MNESDKCLLCMEPPSEWGEANFEAHLRERHSRPSVENVYDEDLAIQVFDDDPEIEAEDENNRTVSAPDPDSPEMRGKKWFMIGVGGAGNHILDTLLLRRDTLMRNNDPLSVVWQGGLAGYLSLNTNDAEISETYYAKSDLGLTLDEIRSQLVIANRVYGGKGAGRQWTVGRDTMQWEFDEDRNPIDDGKWPVRRQDLTGAQAIMFIHSVTKGTGCGATPVLAKELHQMLQDESMLYDKPMLSSVVLPKTTESRSGEMIRGVVGTALLSQWVKGIIPFDNTQLAKHAKDGDLPEIEDLDRVPKQYQERNRVLVKFIESFMLSSVPTTADTANPVSGDVFDVRDSFGPVMEKYRIDPEREFQPAVVMAPVVGRLRQPSFDGSSLDLLAQSALTQGRLVECEPKTAWGGTFLVYGPKETMQELRPLLDDGRLRSALRDQMDADDVSGSTSVDVYTDQLVVPDADGIHLWGILWNPKIPPLQRMYDYASEHKDQSGSKGAEALRDVWNLVEPLFGALGRENMG